MVLYQKRKTIDTNCKLKPDTNIYPYQNMNRIELTAVQRRLGEYCNSRDARSIASGGIRL